jgi:hypothetical protein
MAERSWRDASIQVVEAATESLHYAEIVSRVAE